VESAKPPARTGASDRTGRPALSAPGPPCYGFRVRDPYEVLGIGRNASEADVKSAFRRLAAKHHPDRNPDDPQAAARFKEINQAHQILSDPEKRAAWDRFGEAAFRPGGVGPAHGGAPFVDLGGLDGIFGDILGAFGIRGGDRGNVRHKLEVSFEEAARGCSKEIQYEVVDSCDVCKGNGAKPDTPVTTCLACNGRGRVHFQQAFFPIAVDRACSRCRGTGRIPSSPCSRCGGSGLTKQTRRAEIQVPAGIEDGSSRVIESAGNRTRPDRVGDLEVLIQVAAHPFFQRDGDDVLCQVPITFVQAALGGEIEVPTLDGKVKMRIPPSTQPGSVLRIKSKGIPHRMRGGRGDQLVEVGVEVPTRLSDRARELINELGQELGEDVQPQQKTFVEKLKSLFG
jgi:molecular chaperone DnaJ